MGTTFRSRFLVLAVRRLAGAGAAAAGAAAPAAAGLAAPFACFAADLGSAIANRERRRSLRSRPLFLLLAYFLAVARLRPATVFLAPRRVRALVRVRCPCTGRLRRWRTPR